METTILVVDDKASVRTVVRDYLTEEGFRVVTAENGRMALYVARHEKPDLILLDIMMPEMGGYEFLRAYRKERNTPVILLTARLEESDKVLGLELGADDYVTKPFGIRELVARIRAVLRRTGPEAPPGRRCCAAATSCWTWTRTRFSVGDQTVRLTPSEFDLLAALMAAPGRAFTRLELLERLQGIAIEGVEHTVNTHIYNLRAKIEPDPSRPRYIEAVFGVGYRFRAE